MAGLPPGVGRPAVDTTRRRTLSVMSEGGENDPDFTRMVQDVEDQQHHQGWLFGKGALDKVDLLYLRDEAEKQRHVEAELREAEAAAFARAKGLGGGDDEDAGPPPDLLQRLERPPARPASKTKGVAGVGMGLIKVKPALRRKLCPAAGGEQQGQAKKPKAGYGEGSPAEGGTAVLSSNGKGADQPPAPPHAKQAAAYQGTAGQAHQQEAAGEQEEGEAGGAGLPGLLGDYGSSDEDT